MMASIKAKDTAPELAVRKALWSMGFRYRLHYRKVPGTPDIAFPSRKLAIFVNGCFWHAHGCVLSREPKTAGEFWRAKFLRNKERDARKIDELKLLGWDSLTIWECECRDRRRLEQCLLQLFGDIRVHKCPPRIS
jgi:DNA mismatch endonuclease (patch repair protein)